MFNSVLLFLAAGSASNIAAEQVRLRPVVAAFNAEAEASASKPGPIKITGAFLQGSRLFVTTDSILTLQEGRETELKAVITEGLCRSPDFVRMVRFVGSPITLRMYFAFGKTTDVELAPTDCPSNLVTTPALGEAMEKRTDAAQPASERRSYSTLLEAVRETDIYTCTVQDPCEGTAQEINFSIAGQTIAAFEAGEDWSVWVDTDDFTDEKACLLRTRRGIMAVHVPEVFITLHRNAPTFSVYHSGKDPFPRSQMLFRVDRNAAIAKREDLDMASSQANILLRQMRAGNELRIAYSTWPEQYRESSLVDLKGFSAIYQAAQAFCEGF